MKILTFICCLFFTINTFGQHGSTLPFSKGVILVIDGVVSDLNSFNRMNYNDISKISILKPVYAIKIYGEKASRGAVIVTTKKYDREHTIRFSYVEKILDSTSANVKPLLTIDGAIYKGNVSSIDSNNIAGVEFVQSATTIMIYGAEGAHGAINLRMKAHKSVDTVKKTTN